MAKHIYIIRHGETVFNQEHKIQGSGLDSPLSVKGEEQALNLKKRLLKDNFICDLIFSSPLGRAYETATLVTSFLNQEIIKDDTLKEINCGKLEGQSISSIDSEKLYKLRTDPEEKYPDGESVMDVMERARLFLKKLKNSSAEKVLIFSHGNFTRCFITAATGMPPLMAMRIFIDNASLSYLYNMNSYYRLITLNDTSHQINVPFKNF